eukprot:363953-Chlamydomonas_euryale.AAC.14
MTESFLLCRLAAFAFALLCVFLRGVGDSCGGFGVEPLALAGPLGVKGCSGQLPWVGEVASRVVGRGGGR